MLVELYEEGECRHFDLTEKFVERHMRPGFVWVPSLTKDPDRTIWLPRNSSVTEPSLAAPPQWALNLCPLADVPMPPPQQTPLVMLGAWIAVGGLLLILSID